jgi:3-deoxy-manno-octulosonate cytidylyltransferase (CMP-KDO synthetase)
MRIIAVIPARMAATRLPGKPLALLGGRPLVVHVWERACKAPIFDDVIVATDHEAVVEAVVSAGGRAVLTRADHASGSDRVWEVLSATSADGVVNVQGDEPFVDPILLDRLGRALVSGVAPVVTAVSALDGDPEDPNRVKVLLDREDFAVDFSRRPFAGSGPAWLHLGLYAYTREALERFVGLPPSPRERSERLEQLRLIENGLSIKVVRASGATLSIDCPEDLERAREIVERRFQRA